MLRKQKEQEEQLTIQLKNDYEAEITSILEQNKQDIDEMDRVFKEDLDKK